MLFQTEKLDGKRKGAEPHWWWQSCFLHPCHFQNKFVHSPSIKEKAKKWFLPLCIRKCCTSPQWGFLHHHKSKIFFTFSNLTVVNAEPINWNTLSQHWCTTFHYLIKVPLPSFVGLSLISRDLLKQSSFHIPFLHIWVHMILWTQSHQKHMTTVIFSYLNKKHLFWYTLESHLIFFFFLNPA